MTCLAHLSDLHFGRVDAVIVEALVDDVAGAKPDLVVVSGDLTQGARRSEFRDARAFLDRLGSPVLAVPGNHDITPYQLVERFLDPLGRWRSYIAADPEPEWHDEETAVIGLNTARRAAWSWDWSEGRVRRRQLRRLEERLAAVPEGRVRVVVAHHPLLPPEDDPDEDVVGRARQTLAVLSRRGVGLVLSGHLHRAYTRTHEPALTAVDTPQHRPLLVVQGATATSTRLRDDPNAYNRITISRGELSVERRIWTGNVFETVKRAATELPPAVEVEHPPG